MCELRKRLLPQLGALGALQLNRQVGFGLLKLKFVKRTFYSFIITAVFLSQAAHAVTTSEQPLRLGPIASSLGGAGRAAVDATESAWLNPAGLVHVRNYTIAGSLQQSSWTSGDSYRDYAVMLADGANEERNAGGALSYVNRTTLRGGAGAIMGNQQDLQLSLATFLPFPEKNISAGVTIRHLVHQASGSDSSQTNYSLGLLLPLSKVWGLAFVGSDLAGAGDSVAPEARMIPKFAIGLHVVAMPILRVRADWVTALEDERSGIAGRSDTHLGIESWFREDFAFRIGGAWMESRDQTWFTTGVGFKGPRLSFGYSYERDLRSTEGTRHTFDLWMPL